MKFTIDTKEESKEEIKKLIVFLQKLVNESPSYNSESSSSQGAFNMFSSDNTPESSPTGMFSENSQSSSMNMFSDNSSSSSSDMFDSNTATSSSAMGMFSDNATKDSNIFEDDTDIYKEKKQEKEPLNIHEMLEKY